MINILSYQQPLTGRVITDWICYHIENQTEYTKIAKKMMRFLSVKNGRLYRIVLRPPSTAGGQCKKDCPNVVRVKNATIAK